MQTINPSDSLILVVDDNAVNLHFISMILERQGYQVLTVNSGAAALTVLESCMPDLILLDILMPDLDGYEVCSWLKNNLVTEHLPIIFLSALDAIFDKVKAFEVGGVDYINKPFQAPEVIARINNQLRIQTLQRELQNNNERLQQQIVATQTAEAELRQQKDAADRLLLNILPFPIAQRLKQNQGIIADAFGDVSVLFADLVDFTHLASTKDSKDLVTLLNRIFSCFDDLTESYQLEKIKTIGDAYMVVGGLPLYHENHTTAIAHLAIAMQRCMSQFEFDRSHPIQLRIGINLGPVTAGVIGKKKFSYDLWGDTVNVASRMESNGIPNTIQVTQPVYDRLKTKFCFQKRGDVDIKGRGEMTTYFLLHEADHHAEE
ncbi:adenylate/guanylate cyclase domain-containing protein [Prochlorothrix hollandica]|uniref:Adenylate cyclase n=1 Tax=Prochlorothrix hollandica PCC 9006 = CALU 1027 TaxID=317619 RepID=A0A0M2Q042_PROHO|nr:adenylate/guanylate cyclase domain-containing protein [Prochlorothrix hollandica]KKJ00007.1 guanylate cyclase [Prochlorothrix hollandica PCC 9006 = CALU 1027]